MKKVLMFILIAASACFGQAMSSTTTTVSAAALKNLTFSPFRLVAGQAGHCYAPLMATVKYTAGTTPFAVDYNPTEMLFVQTGSNSGSPNDDILGDFPANGFLTQTSDQLMSVHPVAAYDQDPASLCSGVGLYLANDGNGDVINGNGTLKITVFYVDVIL